MAIRRGFTLIELLVVIAIIAILAAILFPVFTRAQEKSRQATCQSHLHEVGQAMRMYGDEWGGKFPVAIEWSTTQGLQVALKKQARNLKMFACPSDCGEKAIGKDPTPWWKTYGTSYNWPGMNYSGVWPHLAGLQQSNPVDTRAATYQTYKWIWNLPLTKRPMVFDGRCWHYTMNATQGSWGTVRGFINVIYCDGHVNAIEYQRLLNLLWGDAPMP